VWRSPNSSPLASSGLVTDESVKARTDDYAAFRSTVFEARELFHAAARAELGVSD
jgi:hypothetical protein